ncbi:MAG: triose-phosphate isomerase [Spirochaetes bacterium]|nr:triose-phosphate isomerase [Spirochaetota bacterium]
MVAKTIFINLKRFDIPIARGGICPMEDSYEWARWILRKSVELGLQKKEHLRFVFFFPQSLLIPAIQILKELSVDPAVLTVGCQGVYREDVRPGGNFGAFTTQFPAQAAASIGCRWALIGHSEERKDKFDLIASYDPTVVTSLESRKRAHETVDRMLNQEVQRALEAGLKVLFCIGETAEERGEGTEEVQRGRVKEVLRQQCELGLAGVEETLAQNSRGGELVIGYEPRWAIGPGKVPPGPEYIEFVAIEIKRYTPLSRKPLVVYGGGLKVENAKAIGRIPSIDGGLVALTRFVPPLEFSPEGLKEIVDRYMEGQL